MSILTPKSWKHRKEHVKPIKGKSARGTTVVFGDYGLKAITSSYVTNRELEAARKVITRYIKKIGKMRLRVYPRVPITRIGLEMPMGSGKGDVDGYSARVPKGKVIFEISGLNDEDARTVLIKASKKLSVKARVLKKGEIR